ncbi:MAG: penicillin-binding transpeptidase domain-containing protein [Bryobacteraceae bacterium]
MRRLLICLLIAGLFQPIGSGASKPKTRTTRKPVASSSKKKPAAKRKRSRASAKPLPPVDPTLGDNVDGDDLNIRRAAVEALGGYNGSVVVVDPRTGRVLTIVNQKLAYTSGFTPCSTIKLVTALAALSEGIIERDTPIRLSRRTTLNLTSAIAHSNNPYFAKLGVQLGFDRVTRYARAFGLGEKAGLEIEGEQPGIVPREPPKYGGVGMMTSFGEGFQMTPLELASLLSAISNGGTLYYLQYPRSQQDVDEFMPRVKRKLEIASWIPDLKVGMRAAVDSGTARRANYDPAEPVLGKTGTCTDFRASTHMGWFGSFNDVGHNQLVVVVVLTGNHSVNGPVAAGVAGNVYRSLSQKNYFASVFSTQSCCAQ